MATRRVVPKEADEQKTLAEWLDWHRICYCAVPNGGDRPGKVEGRNGRMQSLVAKRLKEQGVKPGVPDLLIFDPPPCWGERHRGMAIELKRVGRETERDGGLSEDQQQWRDWLTERRWYWAACYGADEAIRLLDSLGYGRRPA